MRSSTWLALGVFVGCIVTACSSDDDAGTGGSTATSGSVAGSAGTGGGESAGGGGSAGSGGSAGATSLADASIDRSDEVLLDAPNPEPSPEGEIETSDVTDETPQGSEPTDAIHSDANEAGTPLKVCAEHCNADEDCARDSGVQSVRCHPTTHRCATCTDDLICIAGRSLWTAKTCAIDFDCINEGGFAPFGDVCIEIGGTGYCAFLATSTANCTSFLNTATFSTFTVKKFGSDQLSEVCGKPSRCDADRGSCQNPCTSTTSCTPARGGKLCNLGLGRCECASDGDCGAGAPTCNLAIKQCECGSSNDCSADTGRMLSCQ